MALPYGLGWSHTGLCAPWPVWTVEPDVEIVSTLISQVLGPGKDVNIQIPISHEGDAHRSYIVTQDRRQYACRVSLPVDPNKVASEVATMKFVRQNTIIPIPRKIAFADSSSNDLRFPWMLMEHLPHRPFEHIWRHLPLEAKETFVKQLAAYQAQLYAIRFQIIGCLRSSPSSPVSIGDPKSFIPSPITSTHHYSHIEQGASVGPFSNSYHWLRRRLLRIIGHCKRQIREAPRSSDPDDMEDLHIFQNNLEAARVLLHHLPWVFSPSAVEETTLFHNNLRDSNILIDEFGTITSILDWAHRPAVPLWAATQYPEVLRSYRRRTEPKRERYGPAEKFRLDAPEKYGDLRGFSLLYWEAKDEYEKSNLLRPLYMAEMDRLCPGWAERYWETRMQRAFQDQVNHLEHDGARPAEALGEWLNAWIGEGFPSGGDMWPEVRDEATIPKEWLLDLLSGNDDDSSDSECSECSECSDGEEFGEDTCSVDRAETGDSGDEDANSL